MRYFSVLIPEMLLHKLQMIQNSAARLVTGTHGRDHITPVLFKLPWLPVRYRIEFKLLVLVYQAVHHLGSAYLTSLGGLGPITQNHFIYNYFEIVILGGMYS